MSSKSKNKTIKKIRICSREWSLESDPTKEDGGGEFATLGKDGMGHIKIGTKGQDNRYIVEVILHEIIEGILSHDGVRWKENDDKILFNFDHYYLSEFCPKLMDALISCDMIDPNKKIL